MISALTPAQVALAQVDDLLKQLPLAAPVLRKAEPIRTKKNSSFMSMLLCCSCFNLKDAEVAYVREIESKSERELSEIKEPEVKPDKRLQRLLALRDSLKLAGDKTAAEVIVIVNQAIDAASPNLPPDLRQVVELMQQQIVTEAPIASVVEEQKPAVINARLLAPPLATNTSEQTNAEEVQADGFVIVNA